MQIPSEIDTSSCEGLTRLLRFAIGMRKSDADKAALERLEKRFGLAPYDPQFRGALEDFSRHLDGLEHIQRFDAVCALISDAIGEKEAVEDELVADLLQISQNERILRFSFAPSLLICLQHAHMTQPAHSGCEVRYAGVGPDKELAAFASLFLNLAVYTESNPPWKPDMLFDDGEPNTEHPDLEISFPPAEFKLIDAPHLEESVRASGLPRAVDRGKYDLESVMLEYLCETEGSALIFTSENFLSSTKQSRLLARQHLLDHFRLRKVTELTTGQPHRFLIEIDPMGQVNEEIQMAVAATSGRPSRTGEGRKLNRRKSAFIPVSDIRSAGDTLKPSRYLVTGPAGGQNLAEHFNNVFRPAKYRLADLFEIIRPKATKHDPVGTFAIQEVRAGNISANGEITGELRKIVVRSTLAIGLEEQVIKPGDILFAHRGPIGHVTYVTSTDVEDTNIWASQTLLIFRPRRRSSRDRNAMYCDPKVLLMYLLTPAVREVWRKLATGDRSPSIPIGQIESFHLPENLILSKKPKKVGGQAEPASPESYTDQILAEYQSRQEQLIRLQDIQASMNDGLVRVWETAWTKHTDSEK
ncbi:MAG: hypothetical protein ABJP13_00040 [Sulfitobacter sp.]|uniref:hypothetical protein n=2 Tax=Sulfitobacter sp. TaxID=1903071 RepID=UPI003299E395